MTNGAQATAIDHWMEDYNPIHPPLPGWRPLTPGIHPFSTRHLSGLMGSTTKARSGRQGRLADYLTLDFVVLDELGYLPFAQTGDQPLFHLISRL